MKYVNCVMLVLLGVVMGCRGTERIRESVGMVLSSTTEESEVEVRLTSLENRVYNLEKKAGLIRSKTSFVAKEYFIQLGGGMVKSFSWTKVEGSDFSLDISLYGKNVEVYWQGEVDQGKGIFRIYDLTNKRAVDYSEVSVDNSGRASFYLTKPLSIWRGTNQYYIEGRSFAGDLSLISPSLKIVAR